jgi:hypothetical protein
MFHNRLASTLDLLFQVPNLFNNQGIGGETKGLCLSLKKDDQVFTLIFCTDKRYKRKVKKSIIPVFMEDNLIFCFTWKTTSISLMEDNQSVYDWKTTTTFSNRRLHKIFF